MHKIVLIAITVCLALLVGAGALVLHDSSKKIERRATASTPSISAIVPMDEEAVGKAIPKMFGAGGGAGKFSAFVLSSAADPAFPDDYQLRHFSKNNPALEHFVALDPSARKHDFYLAPPYAAPAPNSGSTDYYWESEYYYNDRPAKFRCKFIIHLEPAGPDAKLEIIEYQPQVWVGDKFDALGHGGPGYYKDLRFVEPTTKDRIELLDYIKHGLGVS